MENYIKFVITRWYFYLVLIIGISSIQWTSEMNFNFGQIAGSIFFALIIPTITYFIKKRKEKK